MDTAQRMGSRLSSRAAHWRVSSKFWSKGPATMSMFCPRLRRISTGVLRGVLIGDQLEFDVRAVRWRLGHRSSRNCPGVMGEVPMRMTLSPSSAAFLARTTESLQYWMTYWASR